MPGSSLYRTPVKLVGQELPRLCSEFRDEQIIRYYTFFSVEMILIIGPEAISELCLSRSDSFSHSKAIELLAEAGLGYPGLLGARGETHKRLRKMFSQVFTPTTLSKIASPMWESCLSMVQDLNHDASSINISQWASQSVLELSGTGVFGQDRKWLARYPDLAGSLKRRVANGQIKKMALSIFPRPIRSLVMLTLFGRQELADLEYVEYVAQDLLKAEMQNSPDTTEPDRAINLISVMLEDGSISKEQLLGHILIFLVGASETTSATFQWMTIELCRHPEVQKKLLDEIQLQWSSIYESGDDGKLFSQIKRLPYLRAVVEESLRLYPAVVLTEHEATENTTIMDVPIPKGSILLCPPLAANSNHRLWGEDAAVFNPDRWLFRKSATQETINQNPCANMTFSHGPRSCPGHSLARMMLSFLTVAFISQYEISLQDPQQSFVPAEAVYAKPVPEVTVKLVEVCK
ncbi:cytochrome P450 [Penicillium verhagenii]|uniref:cytochrome P450 n=1 Tax=Penicillium verhagenii TaxID=1562060 RepID=UPI0025455DF4|nr:cytochrome P450 [Penicillium verhagenii]KAJ5921065.1 cytochrome P450 [Penicillium verhagenii]